MKVGQLNQYEEKGLIITISWGMFPMMLELMKMQHAP